MIGAVVATLAAACSMVEVKSQGDVHVLSYELAAVDSLVYMSLEMHDQAWRLCPKGWDQIVEPDKDYAGGFGEKIRAYRVDDGPFGTYRATVRCRQ